MTNAGKLKRQAAAAAKSARQHADKVRKQQGHASLLDASARLGPSLVRPVLPPKAVQARECELQDLDGDAEAGHGAVARVRGMSARGVYSLCWS